MSSVAAALEAMRAGGIVVVTDDAGRENEGDLIMAAGAARTDSIAFFLRHTSGVLCAAMSDWRADNLQLPPMVENNTEGHGTAFTVTVDAASGVGTGISAADRALTLRRLADPAHGAGSFVRPGHIFPLRARTGGVLRRPGHTEAGVDLARLAGLPQVAVLAEVTSPDKSAMADAAQLSRLADRYRLPLISVGQLAAHRMRLERPIEHVGSVAIPAAGGRLIAHTWRCVPDGTEHVAFVLGDLSGGDPPLVRVAHECLNSDLFTSDQCDCATDLTRALGRIVEAGRGVLLHLRRAPHEVRTMPGCAPPSSVRDHVLAATMLRELGANRVELLSQSLFGDAELAELGIETVQLSRYPSAFGLAGSDGWSVGAHRLLSTCASGPALVGSAAAIVG